MGAHIVQGRVSVRMLVAEGSEAGGNPFSLSLAAPLAATRRAWWPPSSS